MVQKYKYSTLHRPIGRIEPKSRSNKKRRVTIGILVIFVICGIFIKFSTGSSDRQDSVAAVVPKPEYVIDEALLSQNINQALQTLPADVAAGVVVVNLETKKTYTYGTQCRFDAASVGKLITATLYLREVQDGKRSLAERVGDKSAREHLQLMVTRSDNAAWKALNDKLGHDALDAWGKKLGMKGYASDDNQLYPTDITSLLIGLHAGTILDGQKKTMLYNWMSGSTNSFIRQYSPSTSKVYSKAGWLDDRHNEVAIVDNGKHQYAVAVFARRANERPFYKEQQNTLYQQISSSADKAFQ